MYPIIALYASDYHNYELAEDVLSRNVEDRGRGDWPITPTRIPPDLLDAQWAEQLNYQAWLANLFLH